MFPIAREAKNIQECAYESHPDGLVLARARIKASTKGRTL
jgi:hypothetical protein